MARVDLSVRLPEEGWLGDVSTRYPDAKFTVLSLVPGETAQFGLLRVEAKEMRPVLTALDPHDAVDNVDLLDGTAEQALLLFETSSPFLSATSEGPPDVLSVPFDVRDGRVSVTIEVPQHRLPKLGSELERHGLEYDIEQVDGQDDHPLTDRQAEVLLTALERGYYDTPREASMTEIARELGVAKSSCSETLHRAEERIIKRFAEERLGRSAANPLTD